MYEEGIVNMDKKSSRQPSVPPKNGATSDSKKNDNNSPNRFSKYGKKRESGGGRGSTPDHARRPTPQKSRSTGDKRPRSRGNYNDRQREEVAEPVDSEYESLVFSGGSKKASLNHLFNFTFAGRENHFGSSGTYRGVRRPRTGGRVYNKERFLQANCQFVVGDSGDYTAHSIDADTLVDWDLVEQVRTLSQEPPSCPICLQEPQAGKITRCGHVYCWACILHYLDLGEKKWRKCPICYEYVLKKDLKSVQIRVVHAYKPGETITLSLMKRERGSTYSVPQSQWENREGKPHRITDTVNTEHVKLLVASPSQIQETIIEPEKAALNKHMLNAESSEVCFIESALVHLKEREESLRISTAHKKHRRARHAHKAEVDKVKSPKSVLANSDNSPIKHYASAFSDKEDSDEDSKNLTAESAEASGDASLPKSPIPDSVIHPESPTLSLSEATTHSDMDTSLSELDTTADGARGRSSLSESSVGSPEDLSLPEIQEQQEVAMPVEEAAEHLELPTESEHGNSSQRGNQTKSAFFYYQASDGQHIYLHALNARCLVKEYGKLEDCPDTITANIVDTEIIFMTEELRKRLRYLNHLPLTCEFQVAELALKPPLLSKDTLRHFAGDIEKRRRMRQKKMRDDKRRSRKIEMEENEKMGKFPGMRLSLSSIAQFPAAGDEHVHMSVSPEIRSESPSVSSLASSPPVSPSGLNASAAEFVPGASPSIEDVSDGEQTSMSFAQMLKAGKAKAKTVWPRPVESQPLAQTVPVVPRSADTDDSDNEDRVPVPMYQDSFSCAIQAALDTIDKPKEARPGNAGRKKQKKPKFTKLFTTSMTRGK
ncbi:RING finger protein 10-like [Haliotis rubra]|uniref:RING finger protein 10-like n=1 Tax=Haliotis rubra TaxID=36100 RepID=UPI001EE5E6ED|nr:RING finger protein 10-like [Haliotis rubra]